MKGIIVGTIVCVLMVGGALFASVHATSGSGAMPGGFAADSGRQSAMNAWTPPHLDVSCQANPTEIYVNGSGMMPDETTITYRVEADGDPWVVNAPVDLVLAIDSTGSMSEYGGPLGTKLYYAQQSAIHFIENLSISNDTAISDRVALFQFDATLNPAVKQLTNYTTDVALLNSSINAMVPGGNTPFYDAIGASVKYANINHYPPNHTHPHNLLAGHHSPVAVILTDGIDTGSMYYTLQTVKNLCRNSYNRPPPSNYNGYETRVFTVGFGSNSSLDADGMSDIAQCAGGQYFHAGVGEDLPAIYQQINTLVHTSRYSDTAAVKPSPTESMVRLVLPPYISYTTATMAPTANNNVSISNFECIQGGFLWELWWDVPLMKIGQVFEVTFNIYVNFDLSGGSFNIHVNQTDASVYGSDFSKVKYQNYQYTYTENSSDIWSNATPDCMITVLGPPVPEYASALVLPLAGIVAAAAVVTYMRIKP